MVKIELSGCSMHEPVEVHEINSMMDEAFPQSPFAEAVLGGASSSSASYFLEKIFLLHEEFSKSQGEIRTERMSRHMYDIERCIQWWQRKLCWMNLCIAQL